MQIYITNVRNRLFSPASDTLQQFVRYGFVGSLAYVVDISSLALLSEVVGMHFLTAAPLAFLFGLITNYTLSTIWVFDRRNVRSRSAEFTFFALIGVVGLGFNEFALWGLSSVLSVHYLYAKVASTVIVFLWNFSARKYLLFR